MAYLARISPEHAEQLPANILRRLIRMKALDRWRLQGAFTVAIDGTGQHFFRQPHCPYCLTQTDKNGTIRYYHNVLEAKLVTGNGMAFSMATEMIINRDPDATRQDCELKAFDRLALKLKARFPRLPITLLGDNTYACQRFFGICRRNDWHFIVTFKPGGTPALFAEYEALRELAKGNRTWKRQDKIAQHFGWVNALQYEGHKLAGFECREQVGSQTHYFAWLTDLHVGCRSVITLANAGGRRRWKIENEGFNTQKNHGYALQHVFCSDPQADETLYYLLQVAHALNQLIVKGNLVGDFDRTLGSLRNFMRRLAESLRNHSAPDSDWSIKQARALQIRLDDS